MNNCKNCAKQYLCDDNFKKLIMKLDTIKCKSFISWIYTKDYGEVKKVGENKE